MGNPVAGRGALESSKMNVELPTPPSSLPVHSLRERISRVDSVLGTEAEFQRIVDVRRHLEMCLQALQELDPANLAGGEVGQPATTIGVSPITIRTLASCLSELLKLEWRQPGHEYCPDLCKLLDCPQQPVLRQAVCHTIEVLEKTKHRFKSRELKVLREDLQELLVNSNHFQFTPVNVS
jgi:hypothetical protein